MVIRSGSTPAYCEVPLVSGTPWYSPSSPGGPGPCSTVTATLRIIWPSSGGSPSTAMTTMSSKRLGSTWITSPLSTAAAARHRPGAAVAGCPARATPPCPRNVPRPGGWGPFRRRLGQGGGADYCCAGDGVAVDLEAEQGSAGGRAESGGWLVQGGDGDVVVVHAGTGGRGAADVAGHARVPVELDRPGWQGGGVQRAGVLGQRGG